MRKFALPVVFLVLAVGCSSRSEKTDPEARALIEKAIQAQGGEQKLSQFAAGRYKGHGTMILNGMTLPLIMETVYQLPDKYKTVMQFDVQGKKIGAVNVMDGEEGWMTSEGKTLRLEGTLLKGLKEEFYSANVEMLVPLLKDNSYTLAKLNEITVEGKPAVGVKVASKGRKDMELYFDRDTMLPVKTVRPTLDAATMKEATAEVIYSAIKETDGIKWPSRMVVNQDGKKVMEVEITEFKKLDKLAPGEFAKPQ